MKISTIWHQVFEFDEFGHMGAQATT